VFAVQVAHEDLTKLGINLLQQNPYFKPAPGHRMYWSSMTAAHLAPGTGCCCFGQVVCLAVV